MQAAPNYSHIISDMTWSYSRITAYVDCPYKWFLIYIKKLAKRQLFFASYGTFMHLIIQLFLSGELKRKELTSYYFSNFNRNVSPSAPSVKVYQNYLRQGAQYLKHIFFPYRDFLEIERKVSFTLSGKPFIGFIDIVATDSGLVIVDNKSRNLKPRSKRTKPTQSDLMLDQYLRQLYLYSLPIQIKYGKLPVRLDFNCFRSNLFIQEPFLVEEYERTLIWAAERIKMITDTRDWKPRLDYFRCRYLCDVSHHCEYFSLFKGSDL